ncbi:TetR family transcriptional regulator [Vagococcus sp. BWB3-3]|uniref:TetR family transcriptional regulator n=1 Tax=Vagococcus allomyrinae TaxID=2794353 RepID=A0A940PAX2_9ENTE|nr:TetR family transcriptional regulator [Vagococcus allomyrinae]MBP1044497.1 TetR family transcriptional regulator [Vagococcus allomyrinae]
MDIRTQRSQSFLWQAFFDLMIDGNPFSRITVNQICDKAMVHRSTFYKHFEDKYALLDFGLSELFADYHAIPEIKKVVAPFYWADTFFENSTAQQLLETQKKDEVFFDLLKNYSISMMKQDVLKAYEQIDSKDIPLELLAEFHVSTIFTLSHWQAKSSQTISVQEMDRYFKQLIFMNSDKS